MKTAYSVIGKHLTLQVSVNELGTGDCVDLWIELCEQLGITKWAIENPKESEGFQEQWQRVADLKWTSPLKKGAAF